MKKKFLFIGLLLTISTLSAQKKVTKSFSGSGIADVYVHLKFANHIILKNWDKNEISVEATVNIDNNEHNNYFSLKTDKIGTTYTVKSDYGEYFKKYRSYRNHSNNNDDKGHDCHDNYSNIVNYVINVPKNMTLKVKSISGDVEVDSYNGHLTLDLISGDIAIKKHSKNMHIKTISGDIDLLVSDATFSAKTLTGSIYSDLDIDFSNQKKRSHNHQKVTGTIKKGIASLSLETISGDIFLRKI